MRRLVTALTLALLALTIAIAPVSAGHGWCRTDPIVLIDGRIVDIFITGPLDAPLKVTGPNQVVIRTPPDVNSYLVLKDLGFGRGEIVSFETTPQLERTEQGIEVEVAVYVPASDTSMFVGVEFAPNVLGLLNPSTVEGTANEWVVLEAVLR